MRKSLVALFAALIAAATMFASTAEAGFKIRLGFGGPLPHFHAHGNGGYAKRLHHRKRYVARRAAKQKAVVARKSKPSPTKVAKQVSKPEDVATAPAEEVVEEEAEVIADSENSSITTAALEPAPEAAAPVEVKAEAAAPAPAAPVEVKAEAKAKTEPKRTSKLDCKKFFPSVGMTLTVPCE
jgi:hypothetical protein